MRLIKTLLKTYWKIRRDLYYLRDDSGHVGYVTMDIKDPIERMKIQSEMRADIARKEAYFNHKIDD